MKNDPFDKTQAIGSEAQARRDHAERSRTHEKFSFLFILVFLFLVFFPSVVFAKSTYVLPYPSSMPGSLSYKFHLAYEAISKYWYFGDFGQFNYSLKMADKYLVEAKTLFEYKQYLLGYKALKKSDSYFINTLPNLLNAKKNGKNILQKKVIFNNASQKHIDILGRMKMDNPDKFNWQPEKALSTVLGIKRGIESAISIRKNVL